MKLAGFLVYKDIYKSNNESISDLLKGIPSKLILHFLYNVQLNDKKLHDFKQQLDFI